MSKFSVCIIGAALVGVFAGCSDSDDPASSREDGPEVLAMQPAPGTSYVAADQAFTAEFSEAMDEATVEAAYRVVTSGQVVQGQFAWNEAGTGMAFGPTSPMAAGQEVVVQWGTGMRNRQGRALRTADGSLQPAFSFSCQVFGAPAEFATNGERIYFTGTSASGEPITFTMGAGFGSSMPGYSAATGRWSNTTRFGWGMMGGGMMGGGMMGAGAGYGMACATCHGPDGSGGRYLAMGTVETPDIRYATLTAPAEEDEHEHTPYTDEDILRAIREGVEPSGEAMEPFMPLWQMSAADELDLLEFLKSL